MRTLIYTLMLCCLFACGGGQLAAAPTQVPTSADTLPSDLTVKPTLTFERLPTSTATPIPTVALTVSPVASPTSTPTLTPTAVPTIAPSATPTVSPIPTSTPARGSLVPELPASVNDPSITPVPIMQAPGLPTLTSDGILSWFKAMGYVFESMEPAGQTPRQKGKLADIAIVILGTDNKVIEAALFFPTDHQRMPPLEVKTLSLLVDPYLDTDWISNVFHSPNFETRERRIKWGFYSSEYVEIGVYKSADAEKHELVVVSFAPQNRKEE